MSNTIQVCIRIDKDKYDEYYKIREKTGMSIARLIELELKGYKIKKIEESKKFSSSIDRRDIKSLVSQSHFTDTLLKTPKRPPKNDD